MITSPEGGPPVEPAPGEPPRYVARVRASAAAALDVVIGLYAIALAVILLAGGIDLGWLSMREAAKPILVLWILVPIRLALSQPSWLRVWWMSRSWPGPAMLQSIADRVPASIRDAAFAFIVTRLAVLAVAFMVTLLYPSTRVRPFAMPFERTKLAEIFAAWDSGWYFDIAMRGYYYRPDGQSSVTFFPLYPMAMRAVAWPFGSSEAAVWGAGIAISYAAFFAGLVALHHLTVRLLGDREIARRTVLYVAVFPFSFFLTSVYPSGVFFLLAVVSVSAAYHSRWWIAGLCGALATLTRPHGILVAIPLGLLALKGGNPRQISSRLLALAPVPSALVGYSLFVQSLAGDPLAWLNGQQQWGFSLGHPPWEQLLGVLGRIERYGGYDYFFTSESAAFRLFHGAAALLLLALTPAVFQRLGAPLGIWVLVSLTIPLSGNALEGIGRYGAALFPVFMILGAARSPRLHDALLVVWSLFLALFVGLFVTWQPIY